MQHNNQAFTTAAERPRTRPTTHPRTLSDLTLRLAPWNGLLTFQPRYVNQEINTGTRSDEPKAWVVPWYLESCATVLLYSTIFLNVWPRTTLGTMCEASRLGGVYPKTQPGTFTVCLLLAPLRQTGRCLTTEFPQRASVLTVDTPPGSCSTQMVTVCPPHSRGAKAQGKILGVLVRWSGPPFKQFNVVSKHIWAGSLSMAPADDLLRHLPSASCLPCHGSTC